MYEQKILGGKKFSVSPEISVLFSTILATFSKCITGGDTNKESTASVVPV